MLSLLGRIIQKRQKLLTKGNKKKEKLDYILEPLQAMIQICFLNFCPVGSKLTIHDNILQIQLPGVSQGMIRFFNDDTKEDLYFLFNVFRRFIHYYKHFQNEKKYSFLYPEITGYSASTLSFLHEISPDSKLTELAQANTTWLIKIFKKLRNIFS